MKVLKESGFFSEETLDVDGISLRPRDFTSKILMDEWRLGEREEELTVMRVKLKGENANGETEELTYKLHDKYCMDTQTSSMARTTGYTATAVTNLFLEGLFTGKGVFPPELLGKHASCFDYVLNYLEERKVYYQKSSRIV